MTADEQAWIDRVDAVLGALEPRVHLVQRLRSIPMDLVAVAVMKQLARNGVALPFSDAAIDRALTDVTTRNYGHL